MAKASYRWFDSKTGAYSQLSRHDGLPKDIKNFMPKKDGTLVTEEEISQFVVLIKQPEILEPENGIEDFMGSIKLSPYSTGDNFKGKQSGIRYQLALDDKFTQLVGDNTVATTGDTFKPEYGHQDAVRAKENHTDLAEEKYDLIEDFEKSEAKIYVRARYVSGDNYSLWSDPIFYVTPDAYVLAPALIVDWNDIDNVPQILEVTTKFKGLSSDGDTPSITLNSTDWVLKKEDGTVVFESLNDTTNKTSYMFKNKFELKTKYVLEVKFHTDAGDSEVGTVTFTTASNWITVPEGINLDNIKGDLKLGYLGKGEFGEASTSLEGLYKYIGEWSPTVSLRSGVAKADNSTSTDIYKCDVVSYNNKLYKCKEPVNGTKYDITTSDKFTLYPTEVQVPNYQIVLNAISALEVYNRRTFTQNAIKYLSDFDFGGVSGKYTKFQADLGFQYDETGVNDVTGYFVPTKKGDDEQAWTKGNEWYTIIKDGKIKHVSSVHFKYVSPFELGLCHLTGKGRTIRVGYHLWRVSIMTTEEAYIFNQIFDGTLASEDPGYVDLENNFTVEITRSDEDTLTNYEYVRFGDKIEKYNFDPISARLFDDKVNDKRYFPSYRIVLEYIEEANEPWKPENLAKINTGPKATLDDPNPMSTQYIVNTLDNGEVLIYDKFTDTGYFGLIDTSRDDDEMFNVSEMVAASGLGGVQGNHNIAWHKVYYHGKIVYIPLFATEYDVTWQNVMDKGWYVSTPYSSTISKPILTKKNRHFIGGLPSISVSAIVIGASIPANVSSDWIAYLYTVNRSMYSETMMRLFPGFYSGDKLIANNDMENTSNTGATGVISSYRGVQYSGVMQVGPNFIKGSLIYTSNRMHRLYSPAEALNANYFGYGKVVLMGSGLAQENSTINPNTYGTNIANTFISKNRSTGSTAVGNYKCVCTAGGVIMFNYAAGNVTPVHGIQPFGCSTQQYSTLTIRPTTSDTSPDRDIGLFMFGPFLEQITDVQKLEIDNFNTKVTANVTKYQEHLTKVEEQRAIQAALEKAEAEYLRKIEEEGVDERYEGNIKTPTIVDPNNLTRSAQPTSLTTLTASKFIRGKNFTGAHTGTDVQFSRSADFANPVATVSVDGDSTTVRVNSSSVDKQHRDTELFARIRYKSNNTTSDWSNVVSGTVEGVPDLPSLELPFKPTDIQGNKTVTAVSDEPYISNFTYYGHVPEHQRSPYGVNRGTITETSVQHWPMMLQLGDRIVYNSRQYRMTFNGGYPLDGNGSNVFYKIFNTFAEFQTFVNSSATATGMKLVRLTEDDNDTMFGATAAWWAWYIGDFNTIIQDPDGDVLNTAKYMVKTDINPSEQYINNKTLTWNHEKKDQFQWLQEIFKYSHSNINMFSYDVRVDVNMFSYVDNESNFKLLYAPNCYVSNNVTFWQVALNYNCYAKQHTVRLGDYLFYRRLPYKDEVKLMADTGALRSFSGLVLTLDGPNDNFANSGSTPEKKITVVQINKGKFVKFVTQSRTLPLLYLPVLEYIPVDNEDEIQNTTLGYCDMDYELGYGYYGNDNKQLEPNTLYDNPDVGNGFVHPTNPKFNNLQFTHVTDKNIYLNLFGINCWYRHQFDNMPYYYKQGNIPNSTSDKYTPYWVLQAQAGIINGGYSMTPYTVMFNNTEYWKKTFTIPKNPRKIVWNGVTWYNSILRNGNLPINKLTSNLLLDSSDPKLTPSSNISPLGIPNKLKNTWIPINTSNINTAYGILTMHSSEEYLIYNHFTTVKSMLIYPYYCANRRGLFIPHSTGYHGSLPLNNNIQNYQYTYPSFSSFTLYTSCSYNPSGVAPTPSAVTTIYPLFWNMLESCKCCNMFFEMLRELK